MNTQIPKHLEISTPGRICLFGEHQDYLGLPVIAMAISLRAKIDGKKRKDRKVVI
ncbi:MAG: galactokinase family protein, partial [Candidatus Marinimicrobia bacterium]|nr:galactokinase family protein [Candidatus Neomarinimicrobiota bacterium]